MQIKVLFLALCAVATWGQTINPAPDSRETFVGLPQYGVTLAGTPSNPEIVNNSGKVILAWVVWQRDAKGYGPDGIIIETRNLRNGPARKGPLAAGPVAHRSDTGPYVQAILEAVVFGDGEFVGIEQYGDFGTISAAIDAERNYAQAVLSKKRSWADIEALARDHSPYRAKGPGDDAGHHAQASLAEI